MEFDNKLKPKQNTLDETMSIRQINLALKDENINKAFKLAGGFNKIHEYEQLENQWQRSPNQRYAISKKESEFRRNYLASIEKEIAGILQSIVNKAK